MDGPEVQRKKLFQSGMILLALFGAVMIAYGVGSAMGANKARSEAEKLVGSQELIEKEISACGEMMPTQAATCGASVERNARGLRLDHRNIAIQESLSFWAMGTMLAGIAALLLSALGIFLLKRTLDATLATVRVGSIGADEARRANEIMLAANKAQLIFRPKVIGDLEITSERLSIVLETEVENIGKRRSYFLQGQQILYPRSVEAQVRVNYEKQMDDDAEMGPSIDAGFVDTYTDGEAHSFDLNCVFDNEKFTPGEPVRLLFYYTYKDLEMDAFTAVIQIYDVTQKDKDVPYLTTASRKMRIPAEEVQLRRAESILLK